MMIRTIEIEGDKQDVEQHADGWYVVAGRGYLRILAEKGVTDAEGRLLHPEQYGLA